MGLDDEATKLGCLERIAVVVGPFLSDTHVYVQDLCNLQGILARCLKANTDGSFQALPAQFEEELPKSKAAKKVGTCLLN